MENEKKEYIGENVSLSDIAEEDKMMYPRRVENPIVIQRPTFIKRALRVLFYIPTLGRGFKTSNKIEANPKMIQPILQLIKDDGYTDWIEGVKKGLFIINTKSGKQKGILLSPSKLTTLNMSPYPKMWIAYENEMTPYPLDILHDGEEMLSLIRKIESNRDLLKDQAKLINAKMMFWLALGGLSLVAIYFGVQNNWFGSLTGMFK